MVNVDKAKQYPFFVKARFCPVCADGHVRRLTKLILPKTVRVRWICEGCSTLFDVFMGGK